MPLTVRTSLSPIGAAEALRRTWRLALLVPAFMGSAQAADVGVSVVISQPGVYGRVDIGRFPQPQVVVAQPVIIAPAPRVVAPEPVYLWVPPGHRKNWAKHCSRYRACGVPVYFVRDEWYQRQVQPHAAGPGPRAAQPRPHGHGGHGGPEHEREHGPGRGHGPGHGDDRGGHGRGH